MIRGDDVLDASVFWKILFNLIWFYPYIYVSIYTGKESLIVNLLLVIVKSIIVLNNFVTINSENVVNIIREATAILKMYVGEYWNLKQIKYTTEFHYGSLSITLYYHFFQLEIYVKIKWTETML